MTIRKILVPVRGDGKGEGLLDHALALAKVTRAHIEVVHCHSQAKDMLPYGTLMMTPSMKQSILDAAESNATAEEGRLHKIFEGYCKSHNLVQADVRTPEDDRISVSWREEEGVQANVVSMRGRLADLVVVATPEQDTTLGVNTLEAALLETGKLVMMVPDIKAGKVGNHVAIAWNGDSRASRTVTLGLGVLQNAETVSVLSAEKGGSGRLSGNDLVDYLAWHDISAKLEKFDSASSSAGAAILQRVNEIDADSLMMGGYGHSRRRELIMGGVTRHVIENATLPVFMAH